MQEASNGKDTMTGHWEIMGLHIETPFRTFPDGFPKELFNNWKKKQDGRLSVISRRHGTKIIRRTWRGANGNGSLIVYTSADSVLQIAAHEEIIPVEELYRICEIAREMTLDEKYMVGRVIARPFIGKPGCI